MAVYQLEIDGSGAESGAKRIVKSFEDIKSAAKRMEGSAVGSFSAMQRAYKELANVGSIRSDALRAFREFSTALSSFKGPSAANLENTKKFFTFLNSISGVKVPKATGLKAFLEPLSSFKGPSAGAAASVRTLLKAADSFKSPSSTGLATFLNTLTGFKGPSAASAKSVQTLLRALVGFSAPRIGGLDTFLSTLSNYKGPSLSSAKNTRTLLASLAGFTSAPKGSSSFNNFLSSLSGYKGPNANAGKNTVSLLNALATFVPPKNIGGTANSFIKLADAIDRAAGAMSRLRSGARGNLGVPGLGGGSGGGRGGPADLARQYGFLETAIFRTSTALNALGGVLGVKFLANASNNIIKIQSQLTAATGSTQQQRVQFQFLKEESNRLGLEFTTTAKSYGMLLGSIKGTSVTFAEAQDIFRGFSTAARALQLSTEDVDGVFRALGQIMSKGKLQAEELRGQLGDRLPGAFVRFAVALKMTKPGELDEALKKGAISGDKLKTAILSVASTMENEFKASADSAAKTVDSAFNRLKNSFTFSAAEFGVNGFNAALISLATSLQKLLESSALNSFLFGLAKILDVVGQNIELVASIAVGAGVASMLKWARGLTLATGALSGLNIVLKLVRASMISTTAVAAVLQMPAAISGVTKLAVAFRALNVVMRANIFGIVATAVAGFVYYLSQANDKQKEAQKALLDTANVGVDVTNFLQSYIQKQMDLGSKMDDTTKKINEQILANIALKQSMVDSLDIGVRKDTRMVGGNMGQAVYTAGGVSYPGGKPKPGRAVTSFTADGQELTSAQRLALSQVGRLDSGGTFRLDRARDGATFERLAKGVANLQLLQTKGGGNAATEKALTAGQNILDMAIQSERSSKGTNQRLSFSPTAILEKLSPDYNRAIQPPGISGDVPEKAEKAAKVKGLNQYENAIQSAIDAMRDLKVQGLATQSVIDAVSKGSLDSVAAAARATATSRVEDFEQAFKGVNVAKREAGIMAIARAVGLEANSYVDAKQKLVGYYAAQEEGNQRLENDAATQMNIVAMRQENDIREQFMDRVMQGGDAMERANIAMEVETQILNGSTKNRAMLTEELTKELNRRLELNRAVEAGQMLQDYKREARISSATAGLYGQGLNPEDLDRAKQMVVIVDDLQQKFGKNDQRVEFFTKLAQQSQANSAALERARKEYEAIRQLSEETADAIVGAFRDAFNRGGDNAKKFKDIVKDLFKSMRDIMLDFVLFNPLREFLSDTMTQKNARRFGGTSAAGDTRSTSQSVLSTASSGLDFVAGLFGGGSNSPITTVAGAGSGNPTQAAREAGSTFGTAAADIVVEAARSGVSASPEAQAQKKDYFAGLKKVFDYRKNGTDLKEGFGKIGSIFKKGTDGLGGKFKTLGDGVGKVAGAAAQAFGAYSIGKGLAKSLGLGRTGGEIAGGAAAGYSLGGPAGAAIGAAAGLAKAVLFKPKIASSYGAVTVGDNGAASVAAGKYGSGSKATGLALGNAGASVFKDFANSFAATLTAGDYGTFGQRKIKGDGVKGDSFFYTAQGVDAKGKPKGKAGVDFVSSGDESTVQAFALRQQIAAGKFAGLDPIYSQISKNSSSTSMEGLQSDLGVGTNYLAFVEAAKKVSDLQKTVNDLNKSYTTLVAQSKALGLSETQLTKAREKLLTSYRESFDYDVSQEILGFTDPLKAAYNDLLKDYESTVGNAVAVGGNLADVEKLFGLKRVDLLKQYAAQANDSIVQASKDLLTSLTSSQNSPLSPLEVFKNSQSQFRGLVAEISGGNFANAGNLQTYSQNYLDATRATERSGAGYFSVFDEVTKFLGAVPGVVATEQTKDLAALPDVQLIVGKLASQNNDLISTTKSVGAAIVESETSREAQASKTNDLLQNIQDLLQTGVVTGGVGGIGLTSTVSTRGL